MLGTQVSLRDTVVPVTRPRQWNWRAIFVRPSGTRGFATLSRQLVLLTLRYRPLAGELRSPLRLRSGQASRWRLSRMTLPLESAHMGLPTKSKVQPTEGAALVEREQRFCRTWSV